MHIFEFIAITLILLLISNRGIKWCIADDDQMDIENETEEGSSTEQVQESTFQMPDEKWTTTAIKDIAYYLRNYKFNEWDRRYHHEKQSESVGFFDYFPVPPLRSLHWKIYQNCNNNFYKCIIYLHNIVTTAPFTRSDDTTIILNGKSVPFDEEFVKSLDIECMKAFINSEKSGLPFDSHLERFQWRTTASYYMCWYTMLGTPALSMLGESCDNFANCLEPIYGHHNRDIRSDDRLSFACAMYSFCPDPCCPVRYLDSLTQCSNNKANPCYAENAENDVSERRCKMDRKDNQNLDDIIANRWNVSCFCKEKGFVWKSRFGMCVDINECVTGHHTCNNVTEDCLNLPGNFQCLCKWGFVFDNKKKTCVKSNIGKKSNQNDNTQSYSLIDSIKSILIFIGFTE